MQRQMSIAETPLLSPEASDKFLAQVEQNEKIPSGPVPTPKLGEAVNIINRLTELASPEVFVDIKTWLNPKPQRVNRLTEHYVDCGYDYKIANQMARDSVYGPVRKERTRYGIDN